MLKLVLSMKKHLKTFCFRVSFIDRILIVNIELNMAGAYNNVF